jgi:hypothetical protein
MMGGLCSISKFHIFVAWFSVIFMVAETLLLFYFAECTENVMANSLFFIFLNKKLLFRFRMQL